MSGKKMFGALLIAAAVGVTVGVLVAPGKGKDTRKKLRNKAEDLKDKAGDVSDRLKRKFTDLVDELQCEYEGIKEKAKDYSETGRS